MLHTSQLVTCQDPHLIDAKKEAREHKQLVQDTQPFQVLSSKPVCFILKEQQEGEKPLFSGSLVPALRGKVGTGQLHGAAPPP